MCLYKVCAAQHSPTGEDESPMYAESAKGRSEMLFWQAHTVDVFLLAGGLISERRKTRNKSQDPSQDPLDEWIGKGSDAALRYEYKCFGAVRTVLGCCRRARSSSGRCRDRTTKSVCFLYLWEEVIGRADGSIFILGVRADLCEERFHFHIFLPSLISISIDALTDENGRLPSVNHIMADGTAGIFCEEGVALSTPGITTTHDNTSASAVIMQGPSQGLSAYAYKKYQRNSSRRVFRWAQPSTDLVRTALSDLFYAADLAGSPCFSQDQKTQLDMEHSRWHAHCLRCVAAALSAAQSIRQHGLDRILTPEGIPTEQQLDAHYAGSGDSEFARAFASFFEQVGERLPMALWPLLSTIVSPANRSLAQQLLESASHNPFRGMAEHYKFYGNFSSPANRMKNMDGLSREKIENLIRSDDNTQQTFMKELDALSKRLEQVQGLRRQSSQGSTSFLATLDHKEAALVEEKQKLEENLKKVQAEIRRKQNEKSAQEMKKRQEQRKQLLKAVEAAEVEGKPGKSSERTKPSKKSKSGPGGDVAPFTHLLPALYKDGVFEPERALFEQRAETGTCAVQTLSIARRTTVDQLQWATVAAAAAWSAKSPREGGASSSRQRSRITADLASSSYHGSLGQGAGSVTRAAHIALAPGVKFFAHFVALTEELLKKLAAFSQQIDRRSRGADGTSGNLKDHDPHSLFHLLQRCSCSAQNIREKLAEQVVAADPQRIPVQVHVCCRDFGPDILEMMGAVVSLVEGVPTAGVGAAGASRLPPVDAGLRDFVHTAAERVRAIADAWDSFHVFVDRTKRVGENDHALDRFLSQFLKETETWGKTNIKDTPRPQELQEWRKKLTKDLAELGGLVHSSKNKGARRGAAGVVPALGSELQWLHDLKPSPAGGGPTTSELRLHPKALVPVLHQLEKELEIEQNGELEVETNRELPERFQLLGEVLPRARTVGLGLAD